MTIEDREGMLWVAAEMDAQKNKVLQSALHDLSRAKHLVGRLSSALRNHIAYMNEDVVVLWSADARDDLIAADAFLKERGDD